MIRTGLKWLAVSVAVFAVLSMAMREATPTALAAPPRSDGRAMVTGKRVSDVPPTLAIGEHPDSTLIREAHSDGGYWYWMERQPADAAIGGH